MQDLRLVKQAQKVSIVLDELLMEVFHSQTIRVFSDPDPSAHELMHPQPQQSGIADSPGWK